MKILVTGAAGQLGYDVCQRAAEQHITAVGIDRKELNLTDEQAVKQYFIEHSDFDAIVHCAAYTAVDQAEGDIVGATDINVNATKYLVEAANRGNMKFIYISTDYVYDGEGQEPFTETSIPAPVSVYGRTKLEGEQMAQMCDKAFVVRISWVFGINGNNFIKTMLTLAKTKKELSIVDDQVGSPTYTKDLATLLVNMIQTDAYGIYQASNEGYCSWYEFAKEIFHQADIHIDVHPVSSDAFPTIAQRPKNSRMDKHKLEQNGFSRLPAWEDAVRRYLQELNEKHTT